MLAVAARFHTYSPNNVLLIAAQRPDATRVAGYRAWAQLGREVRKGEHGIAILAPVTPGPRDGRPPAPATARPTPSQAPATARVLRGFRVTYVFDISQTDGPALPDVRRGCSTAPLRRDLWAGLLDQVEAAGYASTTPTRPGQRPHRLPDPHRDRRRRSAPARRRSRPSPTNSPTSGCTPRTSAPTG